MNEQPEQLARMMEQTRAETLALFRLADESVLHESPGFGFRPIIWHLAHIGVFESYWLLQKLGGEAAPDARYERIFDPINTPREESKDLPTRREMEDYLSRVRARSLSRIEASSFDSGDPLLGGGYVFQLVLEHERQHQETLAYLFQLLDPAKKTRPSAAVATRSAVGASAAREMQALETQVRAPGDMLAVSEGPFEMGAVWDAFAYDNERPARVVTLPAFKIARLLVTNDEYAHFITEGGYERREFWGEEGWGWREREGWSSPLFWQQGGAAGIWNVQGMFETGELEPAHPVVGVSWYEAEAYARFAGRRLPTEAEWEKAASWNEVAGRKRRFAWGDEEPSEARCNFDRRLWGTTPVGSFPEGASPYGCLDMSGNVWEWTADAFEGFPGFEPYPYPEYSQEWFDGDHRVLKGGSWATHAAVLRTSFRNFFRRHFRIGFAGIRLAEDSRQ